MKRVIEPPRVRVKVVSFRATDEEMDQWAALQRQGGKWVSFSQLLRGLLNDALMDINLRELKGETIHARKRRTPKNSVRIDERPDDQAEIDAVRQEGES